MLTGGQQEEAKVEEQLRSDRGPIFGSYKRDIMRILDEFNEQARDMFQAESRILIPAQGPYSLDKRGIIVEHLNSSEKFEEDFERCETAITKMAQKLDKRTSLYEYPFMSEVALKDKWVEYNGAMVAYNYEL